MTWKKDAIRGMRIGHEILCPLMKAYRKWKLASKKSNERALKLRRRFESECLYFLSDGLGLKDEYQMLPGRSHFFEFSSEILDSVLGML